MALAHGATPGTLPPLSSLISGRQRAPRGSRQTGQRLALGTQATRKFADFLQFEERGGEADQPAPAQHIGREKASELVDRAGSLLTAARDALEAVRTRDPAQSRNRRTGAAIRSRTTGISTSNGNGNGGGGGNGGSGAAAATRGGGTLTPLTSFVWESDLDGEGEEEEGGFSPFGGSRDYAPPPANGRGGSSSSSSSSFTSSSSGGGSGDGGGQSWSQAGLDGWFKDKVDSGPLQLRSTMAPLKAVSQVAVLDRPAGPSTLEFAAPEAPESAGPSIFPAEMQLHFQPIEVEAAPAEQEAEAAVAAEAAEEEEVPAAAPPEGSWERRSGEETGPHGYWYRWTEVRGCDETGAVQWYEKWWEMSDWRGNKELGAEKWGCNARGDAWRETWREAIVFDSANGQPLVERSAHKWAKNLQGNEWEEKWGESYWSAGRAEKWADKWAREGGDVWHEKWGESYDGSGGCVKWTDKWAEREGEGLAAGKREQWGDKWEENFKDGRGTKQGETWSVSGEGERYNRWWGENHFGDGYVQKFGHSNTGEHWDVTESMDTYYNPIPHFGYDLALAHSPVLRNVPMMPRDRTLTDTGLSAVL